MFVIMCFWKSFKNALFVLLGVFSIMIIFTFIALGSPVYIFRCVVCALAKVFYPQLDSILNGQSVMYGIDYFTGKSPRASLVLTSVFKGGMAVDEWKKVIQKCWIEARCEETGKLIFHRFQHYPVQWLGFTFWKNRQTEFSIDNHIHRLSGKDTPISHEQLIESIETVLNAPHPVGISPWEFHVIENYKPVGDNSSNDEVTHSITIFKYHHVLSDGFGMLTAFDRLSDNHCHNSIRFPSTTAAAKKGKKSTFQKIKLLHCSLVATFIQISNVVCSAIRGSQWKITDNKKAWHQIVIKAEPIHTQVIKDIKNAFQVSFNSVLISAISSAIWKCGESKNKLLQGGRTQNNSELFLTMLPVPQRHREKHVLTNQVAGALLDVPVANYDDPLDRLKNIDKVLEDAKMSMIPFLSKPLTSLLGHQFNPVARGLLKNRWVPLGLSNFPGFLINVKINDKPLIENYIVSGGLDGDAGIAVTALTHNEQLSVLVSTEKGLMSREMAKEFVNQISNEIHLLYTQLV